MKVVFKRVVLEDCFAYKYQEFNFTSGIHSLGGINGSSKTSIYLAVAQAFFNKNPKGGKIEDVSNVITKQPYRITVEFSKGPDEYKVVNSRKKMSVVVLKNGKDISRKTIPQNLELIRDILGDSYETFVSMTYQSTESTLDLVEESSDVARKNFINKLLNFDELDELLAINKDKLKRLKQLLKAKQEQAEAVKAGVLPLREVRDLIDLSDMERSVKALAEQKRNLEDDIERQEAIVSDAKKKEYLYVDYVAKAGKREKLVLEKQRITLPERSYLEVMEDVKRTQTKIAEYELIARQTEDKLKRLKEPERTCSRCGQEVSSADAQVLYDVERFDLHGTLANCGAELSRFRGWLWYCKEEQISWETYQDLDSKLESMNLGEPPEVMLNETVKTYESNLKSFKDQYRQVNNEYTEKVRELTEAKGKNDMVAMVIKFNREAEAANAEFIERGKILASDVEKIEKRISLVETWVRILGSNGFRVHRMSKFLQVLNHIMNKYSTIISKGKIRCNFYLSEEGKVEFSVVDADKTIPYSGWSEGEKSRVKLACLFAVIEILEVMGGASYNVLFLDEVFATLDEGGREGLFEVLSHLKSSGKCIYTVSHTPIANPVVFDSAIQVVKENGISRIT